MGSLRVEIWSPPGIATFERRIAGIQGVSNLSGTVYRRQLGQGQFTLPADYSRLGEIVDVDPANHANDVASLARVYRGTSLIQEFLVDGTPNVISETPTQIAGPTVEAVLDWAIVEAWDWDGSDDFTSANPDWIYGGRNLIPPLALGDLNSIREEWSLYLSGERYELDVSLATSGTYTLTVGAATTSTIAWNASHSTIKSELEALAGVTTVSVLQPDSETREFFVVFENPKDLGSDMTADFTLLNVAGNLTKLNDGFNTGANPTFTITVDGQTTTALPWNASGAVVEGSNLTGNGLEGLAGVDDVSVGGSGISSDPWIITFYAPPDPTTVTVTFAAGTAVFVKLQEGDPDPSPVTRSQSIDASLDVSIHGCYGDPPVQVVTTPLDTGADWSLLVNAECQFAGSQIVITGVNPGQLYQASIRLRPTVAGEYTLVIRDEFENFIAGTVPRHQPLASGSFQTLTVSDILIPDGVTRVIMRAAVVDFDPNTWADHYVNWQGAEFREGQAATTVGEIMGDLLDDAQTDHSPTRTTIDFINPSFTDALDSAGAAWDNDEVSISIPRGMTYRKVLESMFGPLGYEWNLTPTVGTPGEWDLNVWNPDGRVTDVTSLDTPSLLVGQGTLNGYATKRVPRANIVTAEGQGGFSSRARNSASFPVIGRREGYAYDSGYIGSLVEGWADTLLAKFLTEGLAPRFDIADPNDDERPVPIVDYGLAYRLNVDLADGDGKISRDIEAVSWRDSDEGLVWTIHTGQAQFDQPLVGGGSFGSPGLLRGGGGGVSLGLLGPTVEGTRWLLDNFRRQQIIPTATALTPSGGGGAPTVVVAPSTSSDLSKSKADLIASGFNDNLVIDQAIAMLPVSGGRVLLTEGQFNCTAGIVLDDRVRLEGLGRFATFLVFTLTGNGIGLDANADCHIQNLNVDISSSGSPTSLIGIEITADDSIHNCWVSSELTAVRVTTASGRGTVFDSYMTGDVGLEFAGGSDLKVVACTIESSGSYAVLDSGSDQGLRLIGCNINSDGVGIRLVSGENVVLSGNLIDATGNGIEVGNQLFGGVIADNVIYDTGGHGIVLDDTFRFVVTGNQISVGSGTGQDGIILTGTSTENNINHNQIVPGSMRYGINVSEATCDCNRIVGNSLSDPAFYSGDAINDAGTDTQWKYPDDPVYGDNFTDCGPTPS